MQRVAIGAAVMVWSTAVTADPAATEQTGERWLEESVASSVPAGVEEHAPSALAGEDWLESGLQEEASPRKRDVFLESGLDASSSVDSVPMHSIRVRFGSGLEEGAQVRPLDVFHQSGLEGLTTTQGPRRNHGVIRFGSGLEEGAKVTPPDVFLESGLESARDG